MDNYAIVVVPLTDEEGGGFMGYVPDLPGCMSDGETCAEAAENTCEAIKDWLEANEAMGRQAPKPGVAAAKIRERDKAMLDALKSAVVAIEASEGQIAYLERQMDKLTQLLEQESDRRHGVISASVSIEDRFRPC